MDAVVEFFLKYRPAAFARGSLAFDPLLPIWAVLALAALAAALAVWGLFRAFPSLTPLRRVALGVMRFGTIGLLALCLCRPVLVVAESLEQRNVVAVLVDDSRSMRIADVSEQPRSATVQALAGGPDSALLKALAVRYQVRVYRTSAAGRVPSVNAVGFDGSRTPLLRAITRVEDELAGTPLSGVVVLTDGAENGTGGAAAAPITDQLATLRSRGVPVYAIGIGSTKFERDIEIAEVSGPRQALRNATVLLDAVVSTPRLQWRDGAGVWWKIRAASWRLQLFVCRVTWSPRRCGSACRRWSPERGCSR